MNRFLVLFQKLRYVFANTPADHDPGLGSFFSHRTDLNFNYTTDTCLVTLTSNTGPILVLPQTAPSGSDL